MNKDKPELSRSHCDCKCHQLSITVRCCPCAAKGEDDCKCGKARRCCGDPEPPNRPDYPKPPGWEPGDKPPKDPLQGATGPDDLRGKFNQAEVGWLSVLTGKRQHGFHPATDVKEVVGFTYPTLLRPESNRATLKGLDPLDVAKLLNRRLVFERGCDELEVLFYMYVDGLKRGQCKAYRIMQTVDGKTTGGYTFLAIKE